MSSSDKCKMENQSNESNTVHEVPVTAKSKSKVTIRSRSVKKTNELKHQIDRRSASCKLWTAVVLSILLAAAEIAGGLFSNSLAIVANGAHDSIDSLGYVSSVFFLWLTKRHSTEVLSFGYKRADIIGAVVTVLLVWIVGGVIFYEAVVRVQTIVNKVSSYVLIDAPLMFALAMVGLLFNGLIMVVIGHDHGHGSHAHSHSVESSHNRNHSLGSSHSDEDGHSYDDIDGNQIHKDNNSVVQDSAILLASEDHADHTHGHSHAVYDHAHSHSHPMHEENATADIVDAAIADAKLPQTRSALGHGHGKTGHNDGRVDHHNPQHQVGKRDLNVLAAYAHALGHFVQDFGVAIASILIWTNPSNYYMQLADPICTMIFSVAGVIPTISVLKASMQVLMQGVPSKVDIRAIKRDIESVKNVLSCHELHVWSLSLNESFLSVHVVLSSSENDMDVVQRIRKTLEKRHNISHAAVQPEGQLFECMERRRPRTECREYQVLANDSPA